MKLRALNIADSLDFVASRAEAWIETQIHLLEEREVDVASRAEAWIET